MTARTNPKCQDCLFFEGPDRYVDLYPIEGRCRRNAPAACLLPITDKPDADDDNSTETPNTWFAADWPIVSGDDWCGEFRIIATPDLLATLKHIDAHGYVTGTDYDMVRAAIAKAENR